MKCVVVRRPERMDVAIYFLTDGPGERFAYVPGALGTFQWEAVPEGHEAPISLRLPEEALEALVAAAMDILPPSREQASALADTRVVRDRLLSLVERLAQ